MTMTCDTVRAQLTAWRDGELPPETVAALEAHLVTCAACAETQAEQAAVIEMAAAWTLEDGADLTERVLEAIATDHQSLLLDEMRLLRNEIQALRAEVADLRRHLSRRNDPSAWFPQAKPYFSRLENDPWNLIHS
jgi:anti-sigma factor RsiW